MLLVGISVLPLLHLHLRSISSLVSSALLSVGMTYEILSLKSDVNLLKTDANLS